MFVSVFACAFLFGLRVASCLLLLVVCNGWCGYKRVLPNTTLSTAMTNKLLTQRREGGVGRTKIREGERDKGKKNKEKKKKKKEDTKLCTDCLSHTHTHTHRHAHTHTHRHVVSFCDWLLLASVEVLFFEAKGNVDPGQQRCRIPSVNAKLLCQLLGRNVCVL